MIIGIGIDVVDIERMRIAVQRTPGVVNKILTPNEIQEISDRIPMSELILDDKFVSSLAARFAAKEAVVKSLGLSLFVVGLHSIEVLREESGAPTIQFPNYGKFASMSKMGTNGAISFLCSLTHSQNSAAAVVIAQS